jgi:GDP-4-dehydro-6-deoxy-D-mannose reductase
MRVLITGVSGFVGSRLAGHLQGHGHKIAGTFIREPPELPGVELFEADLLDTEALGRSIDAAAPEAVIHLAGLSHIGESWSDPALYFQVNVVGTENLLQAAAGVRLVAASSAAVYGEVSDEEQPIPETHPVAPHSPYAWTKAAMERLVLLHGAVVARSFNITGAGQAPNFALPAFAAQLAGIQRSDLPPVLSVGNLAARRDFLHVDDAVAAYRILLEQGEAGAVYNLGSGEAVSIEEALLRLIALSGVEAQVEIDESKFRPVDVPLLRADIRHLCGLGWRPERTLEDALRDLWQAVAPS